jgi:hypothetical protein
MSRLLPGFLIGMAFTALAQSPAAAEPVTSALSAATTTTTMKATAVTRTARRSTLVLIALLFGAARFASAQQIFFLDFDSLDPADPAFYHNYTTAERDQIAREMNDLFTPLGMSATQQKPASGEFSTVFFNATAAGTSDGIDFRNVDKSDSAQVNAKRMLDIVGVPPANMTSDKIVRASVNIGMHEALHLLGSRHQDAFTLPGQGVSSSSLRDNYDPDYLGPFAADLTDRTFMSLTTLLGMSEEKLLRDDFFIGPRTSLKAIVGERVPVTLQLPGINSPSTAQPLIPERFDLPNTMPADMPLPPELGDITADQLSLTADAVIVAGTITQAEITEATGAHYYAVPIIPGAPYTIEVFSDVLGYRTAFTPFDAALSVLVRDPGAPSIPALHPYYGDLGDDGINRDGWEGIDPSMVDLIAMDFPFAFPFEGAPYMLVEVFSEAVPGGDPLPGDYELIVYTITPEPTSLTLLGLGLLALLLRRAKPRIRSTGADLVELFTKRDGRDGVAGAAEGGRMR